MARNVLPPVPTPLIDIEVVAATQRRSPLALLASAAPVTGEPDGVADGDPGHESPDAELFTATRATGKAGEVREVGDPAARARWIVGIGDGGADALRTAGASFIRAANAHVSSESDAGVRAPRTVQVELPADATPETAANLALGAMLGGYRYTVTATSPAPAVRTVRLVAAEESAVAGIAAAVDRSVHLAAASAFARDLANTPSNVKNPAWLAETAERVTGAVAGLTVTVRDEQWLAAQGFGGVLAVGAGSASGPRLIELSYRPRGGATMPHLLLVGKGITFDTGGISIKPADGMHLMRTDMSGGGAVIAALRTIAALKLPVRVTGLVPAAENHVSGSAYRPGDIVRHYGGTTTEVGNTDAEGRMVLADALAYGARKFRPDAVVDVATLTGAMKVALGLRTGGLFANDDALAERVADAGGRVGEAWWRMPLLEDHMADVRSDIADLRQAPRGPGGVVAALFLREFVGELPWAHLDIAGPGRSDRNYADVVPGGTGFAARTLVELAASYA